MFSAAAAPRKPSIETILTRIPSSETPSIVWSTLRIPGMDNAAGRTRTGQGSRVMLQCGGLTVATLLCMHCRLAAAVLSSGIIFFVLMFILAVFLMANPLRHFEVYAGQWSLSGPGRAFRVIPLLEGIGLGICVNAIFRSIYFCCMAAICMKYLMDTASDDIFPFTACRYNDLSIYKPETFSFFSVSNSQFVFPDIYPSKESNGSIIPENIRSKGLNQTGRRKLTKSWSPIERCNKFDSYPGLCAAPEYNYFYLEIMLYRAKNSKIIFNFSLMIFIVICWLFIWAVMTYEEIDHGRLVWNNMYMWYLIVPWMWVLLLNISLIINVCTNKIKIGRIFQVDPPNHFWAAIHAIEAALYAHSAGTGTEIIFGKGLNHYANGHIDPNLGNENVWHSVVLVLLTLFHAFAMSICSLFDCRTLKHQKDQLNIHDSNIWILPMLTKCLNHGNYSHITLTLTFLGLMFSYIVSAYVLVKTALHTIFEYKVSLVFYEGYVIAAVILSCLLLSIPLATSFGLPLLESLESVIAGITVPLVVILQLIALMYMYKNADFMEDMTSSMEDNECSSRLPLQWKYITPAVGIVLLLPKLVSIYFWEYPSWAIWTGCIPIVLIILLISLRALLNAWKYKICKRRK